jgi:hypothetical protein
MSCTLVEMERILSDSLEMGTELAVTLFMLINLLLRRSQLLE